MKSGIRKLAKKACLALSDVPKPSMKAMREARADGSK